MSDSVNAIKGGEYELVAEMWDEVTSEPGKPFTFERHRKGDLVTLSDEDARRLVLAGAVVVPGSVEEARVEALRQAYEAALAQLPPKVREDGTVEPAVVVPAGEADSTATGITAGPGEAGVGADESALPEHIRELKTLEDLRAYAGSNDIDLKGATKKADIQAAIVAAEAE